ncbi:MAG: hypothetical protein CL609_24115 [Anaerolineaceae bacterium]|nr:hypothetical protein [Anaerolineaceae bacterium]
MVAKGKKLKFLMEKTRIDQNLAYIIELIETWPDFYENSDFYINQHVPDLLENPNKCSMRQKMLFDFIKDKNNLGNMLRDQYKQKEKLLLLAKITTYLNQFNFDKADQFYKENQKDIAGYGNLRSSAMEKYREKIKQEQQENVIQITNEIERLLQQFDYSAAAKKYNQIQDHYAIESFRNLVKKYKLLEEKEHLIDLIKMELKKEYFLKADELFLNSDLLSQEEYAQIKSISIEKYIFNQYGVQLNDEKNFALAFPGEQILLSARAGSGKTTFLACKAGLLIDTEKILSDEIMVLAFNKDAATEIQNRIKKRFKQREFDNARTFHSFAKQIVKTDKDLLYDDNESIHTRRLSKYVQSILKTEIKNPAFIEKMYQFFRNETQEIAQAGFMLDEEEYFGYRRNLSYVTLKGEKVKSLGEKYIADYLLEHGIDYQYEKQWLWSEQIYRPNFTIYHHQKVYVLEHWGIDEFDLNKQVPQEWTITWGDYLAQIIKKREFIKSKNAFMIETSIRDLMLGRETFEGILEARLLKFGFENKKLSYEELIKLVKENDHTITKMAGLFTQFIQKAKKLMLTASDVQGKISSYQPKSEREVVFIDLAARIYIEYECLLNKDTKMNFDDLIVEAIEKIHDTKGECEIWIGHMNRRPIKINSLKWLLIDEYQDFSKLFYELIHALQIYNPDLKIICVGDDWQAINGFAGSDLFYFKQFQSIFKKGKILNLSTNFRSLSKIVNSGNELMKGKGTPAKALNENIGGEVFIRCMDEVELEIRNRNVDTDQYRFDQRFLFSDENNGRGKPNYNKIIAAKYLKSCYEIILEPKNHNKSIAILNRTNYIDGIKLREFKNQLLGCFSNSAIEQCGNLSDRIDINTAHKYKGLESDVVIILNVTDGAFPLIHPDNELFAIFGKTGEDVYAEEKRLFYVALTRAKERVYLITEKERESVFLNNLSIYESFLDYEEDLPF